MKILIGGSMVFAKEQLEIKKKLEEEGNIKDGEKIKFASKKKKRKIS